MRHRMDRFLITRTVQDASLTSDTTIGIGISLAEVSARLSVSDDTGSLESQKCCTQRCKDARIFQEEIRLADICAGRTCVISIAPYMDRSQPGSLWKWQFVVLTSPPGWLALKNSVTLEANASILLHAYVNRASGPEPGRGNISSNRTMTE